MLAGEKPEAAVLRVNAAEGRIESCRKKEKVEFFLSFSRRSSTPSKKKNQKSDFSTSSLRTFKKKKEALKSKI